MRWLLLSLALVVVVVAQPQERPAENANKEKSHPNKSPTKPKAYKQGTVENPLVTKRLDAEETPERRTQMSGERDEKMANERSLVGWTIALAVATIMLSVIAGGQLWMFFRQLGYMRDTVKDGTKSAEAARKIADTSLASLRPWLSCKIEIGEPLIFKDGDAVFALHFVVENVGHSPAMSVQLHPSIVLLQDQTRSFLRLKELAKLIQDMPVTTASLVFDSSGVSGSLGGDAHGLIIFPNKKHTFSYKIPIKRAAIEKSCEDIKPSTAFFPGVQGLISYTYPSATVRAITGFSRTIFKIGGAFELDKSVGMDEMRLEEDSPLGDFAT